MSAPATVGDVTVVDSTHRGYRGITPVASAGQDADDIQHPVRFGSRTERCDHQVRHAGAPEPFDFAPHGHLVTLDDRVSGPDSPG